LGRGTSVESEIANMNYPLELRPPRFNYLLNLLAFSLLVLVFTASFSIAVFRDDMRGFTLTRAAIIGFVLGGFLLWAYDEFTGYKRFALIIGRGQIKVPFTEGGKMIAADQLDRARTLSYNASAHPLNQLRYTIWLISGERVTINKLLYGQSQLGAVLEELGCT
jgi:hypothetical protein